MNQCQFSKKDQIIIKVFNCFILLCKNEEWWYNRNMMSSVLLLIKFRLMLLDSSRKYRIRFCFKEMMSDPGKCVIRLWSAGYSGVCHHISIMMDIRAFLFVWYFIHQQEIVYIMFLYICVTFYVLIIISNECLHNKYQCYL